MSKKRQDNFEFAFKRDIPLGTCHREFILALCMLYLFRRHVSNWSEIVEKRTSESAKIMEKFQERIPVIIEKSSTEQKLPELDQQK